MSPNLAGALLMMASMACFVVNDTLIKSTGGSLPMFQLIFLRGIAATALILGLRGRLGAMHLRLPRRDWGLILMRSLSEIGAAYFFLTALMHVPLGTLTAILQVVPLTITLASMLVFGEVVGWRRMSAIFIGFIGVMLIVKPGAEGFNVWSIYALVAVVFITIRDLTTRRLSAGVPSMSVTLITSLVVMTAAGIGSLGTTWVPVTGWHALLIAGAALFVFGGYFFSIQVMRVGDVSFTAPFRYTGLVWALLLGWIVFGDWPDGVTLTGAAIVVSTGLFSLYRERKLFAS